MTIEVPKLLFTESIFDSYCPAGASGRRPLARAEQTPVLLMTHQLCKLCPLEGPILNLFMSTASIAEKCLLAPKTFQYF